ncbi:MAG: copper transporter, partial [Dermatophilaceae bacterium]|nr:copper transporter [Dermatophilaceae bacterium]
MIDFRYHLVSIVSIFLALAVGIVLGAGPLQGELGDTLTNEVAGLREDKAQLNAQLSDATAEIDAREDYIGETNPAILADSLDGQRVAVVVLPGTDTALVESTATSLASSGA